MGLAHPAWGGDPAPKGTDRPRFHTVFHTRAQDGGG